MTTVEQIARAARRLLEDGASPRYVDVRPDDYHALARSSDAFALHWKDPLAVHGSGLYVFVDGVALLVRCKLDLPADVDCYILP